jgi:glycosyltransferase involved in cell wall biosynthesis
MIKTTAVLHVCLSKGWGGLEMYPITIAEQLKNRGIKVFGACLTGTKVESGMKDSVLDLYHTPSKSSMIFRIFDLHRWMNQHQISVIHCHKSGDLILAALLCLIQKRRVIFTEHMGVKRPKKDLYHRWVYRCVDQVLSISEETYQRNLRALPIAPDKIRKLWLGTKIPQLLEMNPHQKARAFENFLIPSEAWIVGCIGRLCEGKGQLKLIEAFAQVKKKMPEAHLLIVGGLYASEGADEEYVIRLNRKIEELQLSGSVTLTGFQRDTWTLYHLMDLVVLPYHNEAFGLTAIEAMAAARPILAAETGALPEILGPTAAYCNPLSADDIAHQIIQSPKARTNKSARERALKYFDLNAHVDALMSVYERADD